MVSAVGEFLRESKVSYRMLANSSEPHLDLAFRNDLTFNAHLFSLDSLAYNHKPLVLIVIASLSINPLGLLSELLLVHVFT